MTDQLIEWARLGQEAADNLARSLGVPDLTQAQADEFGKLGEPEMQSMVGRPVGVTPGQYQEFLRGTNYHGPDLKFMLSLIRGDHLNENFLRHAK